MYIFLVTSNMGLVATAMSSDKTTIEKMRVNQILTDCETCIYNDLSVNPDDFIETIETDKDFDSDIDLITETGNLENFKKWFCEQDNCEHKTICDADTLTISTGDTPPIFIEYSVIDTEKSK